MDIQVFWRKRIKYLKNKNIKVFLPKKNKYIYKNNLGNIIYCMGTHEATLNPIKALNGNLLAASKILFNNKFKSFTYLSSIRVYSLNKKTNENDQIILNNKENDLYFKILKLTAEKMCLQINNPKIRIVRISNIYGHNFKKQKYLLPTLIRNAKLNKKTLITINKNTKKNYLHVADAISVILKIISRGKKRLYNVASDKMISLNYIIETINESQINVYYSEEAKIEVKIKLT